MVASWVYDLLWAALHERSVDLSEEANNAVMRSGPGSTRLLDLASFSLEDRSLLERVAQELVEKIRNGDSLGLDKPFADGFASQLQALAVRLRESNSG